MRNRSARRSKSVSDPVRVGSTRSSVLPSPIFRCFAPPPARSASGILAVPTRPKCGPGSTLTRRRRRMSRKRCGWAGCEALVHPAPSSRTIWITGRNAPGPVAGSSLLAHLLRERHEEEDDDDDIAEEEDEGGDEHRLARLLIGGSIVRRRRLRRPLLARLRRERHEEEGR